MSNLEFDAIKVADSGTPEWLEARKNSIGASEAAVAAGLSTRETPLHLYLRKRGELAEFAGNENTRRGQRWEPYVIDQFSEETQLAVAQSPCPMYRHPKHSFMSCTPDAILEVRAVVDAKTTTYRQAGKFGAEGSDELPVEFICQGQQQMAVMGVDLCYFAVMLDVWTLKIYRVLRNEALIEGLIEAEAELWDRIQSGNPPPPQWGHAATLSLVKEMNKTIGEGRIVLSESAVADWERYRELGRVENEAKKERESLKARVLFEIGDRYAGVLPDGRMIRRARITSEVKAHTKDFIDAREVNYDGGPVEGVESIPAYVADEEIDARFEQVHSLLTEAGFVNYFTSDWNSHYYHSADESQRIRVADHPANKATLAWMERNDVASLRVDEIEGGVPNAVAQLLTELSQ